MRILRSTYHERKDDEFEMEIVREDEENYYVRLLEEYCSRFQEGNSITPIRKCIVGKGELYDIAEIEHVQMNLFEI